MGRAEKQAVPGLFFSEKPLIFLLLQKTVRLQLVSVHLFSKADFHPLEQILGDFLHRKTDNFVPNVKLLAENQAGGIQQLLFADGQLKPQLPLLAPVNRLIILGVRNRISWSKFADKLNAFSKPPG